MESSVYIIELKNEYYNQVKDLLVNLQNFVIEIDKYNLNLISKDYREKYFDYLLQDCNKNQGKIFICVNRIYIVFVDRKSDRFTVC